MTGRANLRAQRACESRLKVPMAKGGGRTNGRMDGRMNGRRNGHLKVPPCVQKARKHGRKNEGRQGGR